jgi:hypothetical protein
MTLSLIGKNSQKTALDLSLRRLTSLSYGESFSLVVTVKPWGKMLLVKCQLPLYGKSFQQNR